MPRSSPKPLKDLASGRIQSSNYHTLTPRTPHSRSGQAEEALGGIELEQYVDDEDQAQLQQQSGGNDGGVGAIWHGGNPYLFIITAFAKRIPLLLGIALAFVLFIMVIISFRRPDVLLHIIGDTNINDTTGPIAPASFNSSDPNLISYANYSNFPLLPTAYSAECDKLMHGFMRHGEYWEYKPQDVPHREQIDEHGLPDGNRPAICNSTITYMLDGHGLLAELGLMVQVAALAREACSLFSRGMARSEVKRREIEPFWLMIHTGIVESKFSEIFCHMKANLPVADGRIISKMYVRCNPVRNQVVEHHHQMVCTCLLDLVSWLTHLIT
jgi:hypothetical protein